MKAHELKKAKRDIRRRVLARRNGLEPQERALAGEAVAARLLDLPELAEARFVAVFWSFGSEVPTGPSLAGLESAGLVVALPVIEGAELRMRSYRAGDPLAPTTFGALKPVGGDEIEPASLDVVVTPAAVFDPDGRRIGYGGGFYDRLLGRASRAVRVGLAFDLQVVAAPLPAGAFDVRVHVICTPTRTIRTGAPT